MAEPFWSDGFDMDLPAVIPGLDDALGAAADITLWTYGHTTHGRLNHPSVWDAAYFGTNDSGTWKPASYVTHHSLVACTWREVLRDAWPHTYLVMVDGVLVWDAGRLGPTFTKLMYDLRGWKTLPEGEADKLRGQVLASVIAATRDLTRLLGVARA